MADNDSTGTDPNGKAPHPPGFLIDTGPRVKKCAMCLVRKPVNEFTRKKAVGGKDSYYSYCKECQVEKMRKYVSDNTEYVQKLNRVAKLKKKYGITHDEYEYMNGLQEGKCAICGLVEFAKDHRTGNVRPLAVDHCHLSGKIRMLLCGNCNAGLGHFQDDPDLLRAAADYIERFREPDE